MKTYTGVTKTTMLVFLQYTGDLNSLSNASARERQSAVVKTHRCAPAGFPRCTAQLLIKRYPGNTVRLKKSVTSNGDGAVIVLINVSPQQNRGVFFFFFFTSPWSQGSLDTARLFHVQIQVRHLFRGHVDRSILGFEPATFSVISLERFW